MRTKFPLSRAEEHALSVLGGLEALARKCGENIKAGLKPLIITLRLGTFHITDRVDVLDASQFLTANIYERSLFKAADCRVTLTTLLDRYNAIVAECETDPSLTVKLPR